MKKAAFFVACALSLSACSGSSIPTPGTNAQSSAQAQAVQRTGATQALATQRVGSPNNPLGFGSGGGVILSAHMRTELERLYNHQIRPGTVHRDAWNPPQLSSCQSYSNGESYQWANAPGTSGDEQFWDVYYYDANCTQVRTQLYLDGVPPLESNTNVVLTGNMTQYNTSGSVFAYNTITLNASMSSSTYAISIQMTDAASATSAPYDSVGYGCVVSSSNTSTESCGLGSVVHVQQLNSDFGASGTLTLNSGTSSNTVAGSATSYAGALNALTLAPGTTMPNWTIAGGTTLGTATITGSTSQNGMTITLVDAANGTTTTVTPNSNGGATGTVVQTATNTPLATFTVDQNGNGTITYSNGTTAQIVDYVVLG